MSTLTITLEFSNTWSLIWDIYASSIIASPMYGSIAGRVVHCLSYPHVLLAQLALTYNT